MRPREPATNFYVEVDWGTSVIVTPCRAAAYVLMNPFYRILVCSWVVAATHRMLSPTTDASFADDERYVDS